MNIFYFLLQSTAKTVLEYVYDNMTKLDRNIPVLIEALEKPIYCATNGNIIKTWNSFHILIITHSIVYVDFQWTYLIF